MTTALTPMERAVLQLVVDQNWPSFRVNQLKVSRREHTGVGRYTYLVDCADQPLRDGTYGADAHFIEMVGVPSGLFFVVEVVNERVSYLEIVSAGADSWDGVERPWSIL